MTRTLLLAFLLAAGLSAQVFPPPGATVPVGAPAGSLAGNRVYQAGVQVPTSPTLRTGLVGEWLMGEGAGRVVYNSINPPQPIYNMLAPSEQSFSQINPAQWTVVGYTVTDNVAANPNGDFVASRVVCATNCYLTLTTTQISGVAYTISLWVKSNTGIAQAMSMTNNAAAHSSDIVVPITWTKVSYTYTAGAGTFAIPIASDAAHDAQDILIWDARLEIGPNPTASVPPNYNLAVQGAATWQPYGLSFNGTNQSLLGLGWQPIQLSKITYYTAFKWNGTVVSSYAPLVSVADGGTTYTKFLLTTCYNVTVPACVPIFQFGSATALASWLDTTNDNNWHIMAATYDGSTQSLWVDGNLVTGLVPGAVNPVVITRLTIGQLVGSYWPGGLAYASMYNIAHTPAQIQTNTAIIAALLTTTKGISSPVSTGYLAFEGDSFSDPAIQPPSAPTQNWTYLTVHSTPYVQGGYIARGGATIANLNATQALIADLALAGSQAKRVLVIMVGANDQADGTPAVFVAALKAHCLARKAANPGIKIVLGTILPRTAANFNTWRNTANAAIAADPSFYDYLMDFAADPSIGCDACVSNGTYFQGDGLHPTAAGHAIMSTVAIAKVALALQ